MMSFPAFKKYRQPVLYGCALAVLLFLLKWLEYRFLLVSYAFEVYITLIALLFTGLGIWLALKLAKPKTVTRVETIVVEKEVPVPQPAEVGFVPNETEQEKLGLSPREMEVLRLMAEGLSNQEIAEKLFLSLATVKTHASNIFFKLEVKRRTQAVEKAKRLQLIG